MEYRGALALVVGLAIAVAGTAASARSRALPETPVYKDAERAAEPGFAEESHFAAPGGIGPLRPARRVTGGPGYSGSEYGLGKPSYNGLGSRPDWGRSSE